jgi:hypothetical protein
MELIKGNKEILVITLTDKLTGSSVLDLESASDIKFQIKDTQTGKAIISKNLTSGVQRNIPNIGDVSVTILPADFTTAVTIGDKYIGLQIEYSATDIREIELRQNKVMFEKIKIKQDIIQ